MSVRPLTRLLLPAALLVLSACAGAPGNRAFPPATAADTGQALESWGAARARADTLLPSRLLYDAHMGKGGVTPVPGTLAVTYDRDRVLSANLTGPFGSRIADYAQGTVNAKDEGAVAIDPDALRSILAGVWPGAPSRIAGRNGTDCLLVWDAPYAVSAVLDLTENRLRSIRITGNAGLLEVSYSGTVSPWPEKIAIRDAKSGRSLTLALLAVEPSRVEGKPQG